MSSDPGSCFLKCPCVPGACLCACVLENLTSVSHGLAILVRWKESYYPEHQEHQYACRKTCLYKWLLGKGDNGFQSH